MALCHASEAPLRLPRRHMSRMGPYKHPQQPVWIVMLRGVRLIAGAPSANTRAYSPRENENQASPSRELALF